MIEEIILILLLIVLLWIGFSNYITNKKFLKSLTDRDKEFNDLMRKFGNI